MFFMIGEKKVLHLIARAASEISKGRQVISPEDLVDGGSRIP